MTSGNSFRGKSVAVTGKLDHYTCDGIKALALEITILSEQVFEDMVR